MHHLTNEIADLYYQLVPSREEMLLLIELNQRIKNGEIDARFSTQDIQRAIEETAQLSVGYSPNRERLVKNLLNYFIERPSEHKSLYSLTEYARKMILLLDHKINNPFRKFPLRESFNRYADFSAQEVQHINQFESWFNQGFQATTRENIFDHLEELKIDVQLSVQRLNMLIYAKDSTVMGIVGEFSVIFTDLGNKADEIRDTLRLGNTLLLEVEQVVSNFYEQADQLKSVNLDGDVSHFEAARYAYSRSQEIQSEIKSFFEVVDGKLGQLRERIVFASSKLNELPDLFRYQSHFKLNLKRLLELVLSESKNERGVLTLPASIDRKRLVQERFKLTQMPDLEREYALKNAVVEPENDEDYHKRELVKVEAELLRQQRTAVLIEAYKEQLEQDGKLDLTAAFYDILDSELDEETAIHVGYELILFAHEAPALQVDIRAELNPIFEQKPIITWKMNFTKKP